MILLCLDFNAHQRLDYLTSCVDTCLHYIQTARGPSPALDQTVEEVFYDRISRMKETVSSSLKRTIEENLSPLEPHRFAPIKGLLQRALDAIIRIKETINLSPTEKSTEQLISFADDCLFYHHQATYTAPPKELGFTLNEVFYDRVLRIAEGGDPLFRKTLKEKLQPLEAFRDKPIRDLDKDSILKICEIRTAFLDPHIPSHATPRDSRYTPSLEEKIEGMSYAEKIEFIDAVYAEPRNQAQGLSEHNLHALNQQCVEFLQTHFGFTDRKELPEMQPYSQLLSVVERQVQPSLDAPEGYKSYPTQFLSDFITGTRMSYLTATLPEGTVSTKTKEDEDTLIQLAKNLATTICPEGTSPALLQKMENTILTALSQHTGNMFLGPYLISTKTELGAQEILFSPVPDDARISLSPILDAENRIIPYAFNIEFEGTMKHRFTELKTEKANSPESSKAFNKLRDELGIGSVATARFTGGYELHLAGDIAEARNIRFQYSIELDNLDVP